MRSITKTCPSCMKEFQVTPKQGNKRYCGIASDNTSCTYKIRLRKKKEYFPSVRVKQFIKTPFKGNKKRDYGVGPLQWMNGY